MDFFNIMWNITDTTEPPPSTQTVICIKHPSSDYNDVCLGRFDSEKNIWIEQRWKPDGTLIDWGEIDVYSWAEHPHLIDSVVEKNKFFKQHGMSPDEWLEANPNGQDTDSFTYFRASFLARR